MKYLGLDVHTKSTTWCLLDSSGARAARGRVATTAEALAKLSQNLSAREELLAGQEVGAMSYFVHDVVAKTGVQLMSFNAQHLRIMSSSRKKTDKRDAFWIAKALQTGMYPHPVYLPPPPIRRLRSLLTQSDAISREHTRWRTRARSYLRASGVTAAISVRRLPALVAELVAQPEGVDVHLVEALEMCHRQIVTLGQERHRLDELLLFETREVEEVRRLMTLPGIGRMIATAIYAWVGDVTRFPNARALCAYAGLVPSVRQSGQSTRLGHINKLGSPMLRKLLVQGAQVLMSRCRSAEAKPLQDIVERVYAHSRRKKIAIVAGARHLLRIAFYILRDGSVYQPKLLSRSRGKEVA